MTAGRVLSAPTMPPVNIPPNVARLCEEELLARVPRLRAAIVRPDSRQVREDAHALRGMVANIGMREFAAALGALEDAAGDGTSLKPLLAAVEPHVAPALEALAACR